MSREPVYGQQKAPAAERPPRPSTPPPPPPATGRGGCNCGK